MTPCEWHPAVRLMFDVMMLCVLADYARLKWRETRREETPDAD